MKPEWITDNLLELAKRLHELGYRKEIREGDWYIWGKDVILRVTNIGKFPEQAHPIPALADCLDWLEYHGHEPHIIPPFHSIDSSLSHEWLYGANGEKTEAPTPTEAAYLAMIKILGGE